MRRGRGWLAAALACTVMAADAQEVHLLVMDLPHARVWEAALRALVDYPIVRAADGMIETGRLERPPGADAPGAGPIAEQVTVRVEAMAERVTRITVTVRGDEWREGAWVPLPDTEARARGLLGRIREAASQPP